MSHLGSHDRRFLILLMLLALLAGGLRTGWFVTHQELLTVDVDGYLDIARNLATGAGYSAGNPPYQTAFRPPFYPVIVALMLHLPGGLWALAVLQILMGMAMVAIVGLIALRVGASRFWSLVAATAVAVDPVLIHVAATPMTETLCTFLIALWALSVTSTLPNRQWTSGLLLGLLTLCRPTFLPFIVLQFFCLSVYGLYSHWLRKNHDDLRNCFRAAVIQFVCILLCLFPWFIRNGFVIGKWTPATTHGGYTLLLGNNETFYREVLHAPWGTSWKGESLLPWQEEIEQEMKAEDASLNTEPERDAWFYRLAFRTIRNHPGDFLLSCVWRFCRLWDLLPQYPIRDAIPVPIRWGMIAWYLMFWGGMLIGIVVVLGRGKWKQIQFPLMILNVSIVHLFYWTDLRMRAPLIPLVAVLAVLGWQRIFGDRAEFSEPRDRD